MGLVVRAVDPATGQVAAIKLVRATPGHAADRFAREVAAMRALDHPGIVRLLDAGEAPGLRWLAMELVDGSDLAVAAPGLARAARLGLLVEVARAVHAAHLAGFVHRDLKPGNVLVGRDGRARVTDFGLVRDLAASVARLTATGALVGTPSYMAPEQVQGGGSQGGAIGPWTDVWALGAMTWELASGGLPFAANNVLELSRRIFFEPPEPFAEPDPHVEAVGLRALEKEPAARYPSALAFADDLERALRGETPWAAKARPLAALSRHRGRLVLGFVAVVVVLLAAIGLALLLREARGRAERRERLVTLGEAASALEKGAEPQVGLGALLRAARADGAPTAELRARLETALTARARAGLASGDAAGARRALEATTLLLEGGEDVERLALAVRAAARLGEPTDEPARRLAAAAAPDDPRRALAEGVLALCADDPGRARERLGAALGALSPDDRDEAFVAAAETHAAPDDQAASALAAIVGRAPPALAARAALLLARDAGPEVDRTSVALDALLARLRAPGPPVELVEPTAELALAAGRPLEARAALEAAPAAELAQLRARAEAHVGDEEPSAPLAAPTPAGDLAALLRETPRDAPPGPRLARALRDAAWATAGADSRRAAHLALRGAPLDLDLAALRAVQGDLSPAGLARALERALDLDGPLGRGLLLGRLARLRRSPELAKHARRLLVAALADAPAVAPARDELVALAELCPAPPAPPPRAAGPEWPKVPRALVLPRAPSVEEKAQAAELLARARKLNRAPSFPVLEQLLTLDPGNVAARWLYAERRADDNDELERDLPRLDYVAVHPSAGFWWALQTRRDWVGRWHLQRQPLAPEADAALAKDPTDPRRALPWLIGRLWGVVYEGARDEAPWARAPEPIVRARLERVLLDDPALVGLLPLRCQLLELRGRTTAVDRDLALTDALCRRDAGLALGSPSPESGEPWRLLFRLWVLAKSRPKAALGALGRVPTKLPLDDRLRDAIGEWLSLDPQFEGIRDAPALVRLRDTLRAE